MTETKTNEYRNQGDLCSFPYDFLLEKKENEVIGHETSYIYCDLKFNDAEKKEIEEELAKIHTAKGSHFCLEGTQINYHIDVPGNPKEADSENEVDIRRNFIENYLEAQEELDALVKKYHGSTKKTEFTHF